MLLSLHLLNTDHISVALNPLGHRCLIPVAFQAPWAAKLLGCFPSLVISQLIAAFAYFWDSLMDTVTKKNSEYIEIERRDTVLNYTEQARIEVTQ